MAEPTIIERRPTTELARLDPQALIAKAIETGAGIETMERLVALANQVREITAREAWYEAMAEFQRLCPPIIKTKSATIPTRGGGSYSYKYSPLDEILGTVQPVMGPLGLSIAWVKARVEGDKILVNCRISHTLGHYEESGDIPMPIITANADVGANPMQRIGIASTYAKRYSLLMILGKSPEDDDDGESAGTGATGHTAPPSGGQDPDALVTEPQIKRLSAIASGQKWTDDQVHELLTKYRYNSRKEIKVQDYEAICDRLKKSPAEGLKDPKPANGAQGNLA